MAISKKELEKGAAVEEMKAAMLQKYQDKEAQILAVKTANSAAMFKNTKIASCSKILQKNG
jgi:hypothetical protein